MSIVNQAIGFGNKVFTMVRPHIPTIAVVGGSAAVLGGTFFACKATLKVDQILDEHRGMMQHITDSAEKLPLDRYSKKDMAHDKLQVYAMTSGKLFKLYAPAIGLSIAGFASIFYGFGLIKQWHAMAVSSVAALDKSFGEYRNEVIKRYGREVDEEITKRRGQFHQVEKKTVDENGDEKTETVDTIALDDIIEDDFTRIFDWRNPKWESDYLFNDNFLTNKEQWWTLQLQSGRMDHVFLNTILKDLGYEDTGIGHFYGWTRKPGCEVRFQAIPFIRMWNGDDDDQFPCIVPINVMDDNDYEAFKQAYIDNEKNVGYILKFNVDCDENGVAKEIYHEVYGGKVA